MRFVCFFLFFSFFFFARLFSGDFQYVMYTLYSLYIFIQFPTLYAWERCATLWQIMFLSLGGGWPTTTYQHLPLWLPFAL